MQTRAQTMGSAFTELLEPARDGIDLSCESDYAAAFASQVARTPNQVAAIAGDASLTYAELDAQATRLAVRLAQLEVGPEVVVAVALERSLALPIAMLAIWKAGGAYLPLDLSHPPARLNAMIADAHPKVILTARAEIGNQLRAGPDTIFLAMDELVRGTDGADLLALTEGGVSSDSLAYVIYTSGSTGRPKGVEVTHRSLLHHNFAIMDAFDLSPRDRVLQFASLSFDVSLEEMLPSWLAGATVVFRPPDVLRSVETFLDFVNAERLTVLNLPTAFWHEFVDALEKRPLPDSVRLVVIGGERAADDAWRRWQKAVSSSVRLINAYGPTETTITATIHEARGGEPTLPIGRPVVHAFALVVDDQGRLARPSETGELLIGGPGVARGYRNQPELTREKFIPNLWPDEAPCERLYRTGDVVRWNAQGCLEFVGRVDDQIKLLGYRIEPGEIESALLEHPGVQQAAVQMHESAGLKRLVAFYQSRGRAALEAPQLREFLATKLPLYMVPAQFVPLADWPVTPAGKLDRRALPAPAAIRPPLDPAPAGSTVETVSRLVGEVLQISPVSQTNNFLELGGNSLLAMKVISRLRDAFQVELPIAALFESPTLADVAHAISSCPKADSLGGTENSDDGLLAPASLVQERLWFLNDVPSRSRGYYLSTAFRLTGDLDVAALEASLNNLVQRHEVLRTSFRTEQGQLCQAVEPALRVSLVLIDLTRVSVFRRKSELQRQLVLEAHQPFNLEQAPLFRTRLFRSSKSDHTLLLTFHHAIMDGWSMGIFFRELAAVYRAHASGAKPETFPAAAPYRQYARWQRRWLKSEAARVDVATWKRILANSPGEIKWPTSRLARTPGSGAGVTSVLIESGIMKALASLAQNERTTSYAVLVTALAKTLAEWAEQDEFVLGTVVAGRSRREFENTIGCFMNFVPLRLRLDRSAEPQAQLRRVRQVILEAQAHQELPFDRLVAALNPSRTGDRNPFYNAAVVCHDYPAAQFLSDSTLRAEPLPLPPNDPLLDLHFEAEPHADEWRFACTFDRRLFDEAQIKGLLRDFKANLGAFVVECR